MREEINSTGIDFITKKVKNIKKWIHFRIPIMLLLLLIVLVIKYLDKANAEAAIAGFLVGISILFYVAILPTIIYIKIANNVVRHIYVNNEYIYLNLEKAVSNKYYTVIIPLKELQTTRINKKSEYEFFERNEFLILLFGAERYYIVDNFWDNNMIIFNSIGINS